jgi:hypothetical protein
MHPTWKEALPMFHNAGLIGHELTAAKQTRTLALPYLAQVGVLGMKGKHKESVEVFKVTTLQPRLYYLAVERVW